MEDILGDLLRVETRLHTQAQLDVNQSSSAIGTVFAANRRPHFYPNSGRDTGAPSRPEAASPPSSEIKCRHCQEMGHLIAHCKQRNICNYCKRSGHIITECRTLQNRGGRRPAASGAFAISASANSNPISDHSSTSTTSLDTLVQEALSRVLPSALQSAFSTVGISGSEDTSGVREGK
ncbi:hypothetical protein LINPERHAP2_LOCUS36977 [Linum perenne]